MLMRRKTSNGKLNIYGKSAKYAFISLIIIYERCMKYEPALLKFSYQSIIFHNF